MFVFNWLNLCFITASAVQLNRSNIPNYKIVLIGESLICLLIPNSSLAPLFLPSSYNEPKNIGKSSSFILLSKYLRIRTLNLIQLQFISLCILGDLIYGNLTGHRNLNTITWDQFHRPLCRVWSGLILNCMSTGDPGVGKTNVLLRYTKNQFDYSYTATRKPAIGW